MQPKLGLSNWPGLQTVVKIGYVLLEGTMSMLVLTVAVIDDPAGRLGAIRFAEDTTIVASSLTTQFALVNEIINAGIAEASVVPLASHCDWFKRATLSCDWPAAKIAVVGVTVIVAFGPLKEPVLGVLIDMTYWEGLTNCLVVPTRAKFALNKEEVDTHADPLHLG